MTTEITKIINGFKEFSEEPYQDSINFLRDYIKVESSGEAHFELGKALFFTGEYDESIFYMIMTSDYRKDAYLGLAHFKKQDFENAVIHFRKFLKDHENVSVLEYLMIAYEKMSDWHNAIVCAERLLEIGQNVTSIKMRLIDYHFNFKQYQEALDYIDELNHEKYRYKKGLVLFRMKRYEEAIDEVKGLKSVEAYKLMSEAFDKLERQGRAIDCLKKAYEIDRNIETLFEIAEYCFKNGFDKIAYDTLNEILEIDEKNEMALERLADAYMDKIKYDHAVQCCQELLKINDKNIKAHEIISKAYYRLDELEKSLKITERGLAIDPKSADLWVSKAWCHYHTDFKEFVSDYERALKLEPNNTENYRKLIWYCAFEDRMDYAHKFYKKLLFYNPAFALSFEDVTRYAI